MNRKRTILAGLLGGLLVLSLGARGTRGHESGTSARSGAAPAIVVGTFDSRALAIAHLRSAETTEYLRAQHADLERALERARAAGDRALAAELEQLGPHVQERVHRQGFGTAPVDELLALLAPRLPAIAAEAGVDVIVSRWQLAWQGPQARFVDVTERLAAEFHPDEATLRAIREVTAREPLPEEDLEEGH